MICIKAVARGGGGSLDSEDPPPHRLQPSEDYFLDHDHTHFFIITQKYAINPC